MDSPHDTKSYERTQLFQQSTRHVITAYVLTQMSAAQGIKVYGDPAVAAIQKEFCQLHNKGVFEPKHASSLTSAQKRASLRAVNLIKEKRTGELKGRTCADGSIQRSLYDKSETTSPTVATDALMYTLLIDAKERRDVATADVVGAYLNADMDQFTVMKLTGDAVNIMIQVDSSYAQFVSRENNKPVLYLQLKKALYGCVRSALLWYELFANTLLDMGFELNPYDSCVANKIIEGTQCTVAWYVDDNKISHKNPSVVTSVIEQIEERFGKMTVTRGKEHVFLGMKFNFNDNGTVSISMKSYLEESIKESDMNIKKRVATPAKGDLFDINDDSPQLIGKESDIFHSVVAKLLYVSLRARPDILLAVSFLCTRVSKSTKQDQEKLMRVLEYLNGTLDLTLTLGADDLGKIRTWVDASYAVHPDMKSHTGGVMSMGTGAFLCKSTKQKLNTKSSTEAELVGATDYIPNSIWSKMFLEAQGHQIVENVFEQDNVSAIRLEKNGRASAGKKSRHIHIRYFFMKDRVKQDSILVRHCPTEAMLADFLTKPLQGNLFRKFRSVLLGYQHTNALNNFESCASSSEERVELCNASEENLGPEFGRNSDTHARNSIEDRKPSSEYEKGFKVCKESTIDPTWAMVVSKKNRQRFSTSTSTGVSSMGTGTGCRDTKSKDMFSKLITLKTIRRSKQ
jgi:Reverse transcriptase (RNA-dependent DNA polymerase)